VGALTLACPLNLRSQKECCAAANDVVGQSLPHCKKIGGPRTAFLSAGTESALQSYGSAYIQVGDSPLSASHEMICAETGRRAEELFDVMRSHLK
jgi:hypothetical protein